MMMIKKKSSAIATERSNSDFDHLACVALKSANSNTIDGVERCFDTLRCLGDLNKDLYHSLSSRKTSYYELQQRCSFVDSKETYFSVFEVDTKRETESLPITKKKSDGFKSFEAKPILTKKRSALPIKLSENPSKSLSTTTTTTRTLQMKKKQPHVKVSANPKQCSALKKNSREMLELFEVAKKSADVANTKGLLLAKAETSICVETLSLYS
ncbi:unnamed protein product [Cochlearia groenlandica]